MWYLLHIFFLYALTFDPSDAACGACGETSRVLCRNETHYSFCSGPPLVPAPEVHVCPANTVCVNEQHICAPTPARPDCIPQCGKCGANMPFACMSQNSYAFCDNEQPIGQVTVCPGVNQVCVRDQGVCITQDFTVNPPSPASTCVAGEIVPPPTPGPIDPDALCQEIQQLGNHPLPNECKKYLRCYRSNWIWHGTIFNCWEPSVFDTLLRVCLVLGNCQT